MDIKDTKVGLTVIHHAVGSVELPAVASYERKDFAVERKEPVSTKDDMQALLPPAEGTVKDLNDGVKTMVDLMNNYIESEYNAFGQKTDAEKGIGSVLMAAAPILSELSQCTVASVGDHVGDISNVDPVVMMDITTDPKHHTEALESLQGNLGILNSDVKKIAWSKDAVEQQVIVVKLDCNTIRTHLGNVEKSIKDAVQGLEDVKACEERVTEAEGELGEALSRKEEFETQKEDGLRVVIEKQEEVRRQTEDAIREILKQVEKIRGYADTSEKLDGEFAKLVREAEEERGRLEEEIRGLQEAADREVQELRERKARIRFKAKTTVLANEVMRAIGGVEKYVKREEERAKGKEDELMERVKGQIEKCRETTEGIEKDQEEYAREQKLAMDEAAEFNIDDAKEHIDTYSKNIEASNALSDLLRAKIKALKELEQRVN